MKKALTLILLFTSLKISAQIEKPITKGNYIIGGSISGSYQSSTNNETFYDYDYNDGTFSIRQNKIKNTNCDFVFSPNIGYFIFNGLSAGITPTFSISNQKIENNATNGTSGISKVYSAGTGTYLKYYFQKGFLLNLNIQYLFNKSHSTNESNSFITQNGILKASSDNHYNTVGISPGLGYAIFLNSKISLEMLISYLYQQQHGTTSSSLDYIATPGSSDHSTSSGKTINNSNGIYLTIGLNTFLK